ncbi:glucose-6-phosphate isomerase family protein [Nocardiopsis nanhaiensis]
MSDTSTAPAALQIDPVTGALAGATGRYDKRMRDLAGLYQDRDAYARAAQHDPDRLMYRVHEHRREERPGDLIFGTSVLEPGTVGREYAMTRGHLHEIADRTEIYSCLRGHGILLMEHVDGRVHAAEMRPGTVVYVGPHWIHRSVNVGAETLVTLFCYPGDSGQDYGIIERSGGMRSLIVTDGNGGWAQVDNPGYRPRNHP